MLSDHRDDAEGLCIMPCLQAALVDENEEVAGLRQDLAAAEARVSDTGSQLDTLQEQLSKCRQEAEEQAQAAQTELAAARQRVAELEVCDSLATLDYACNTSLTNPHHHQRAVPEETCIGHCFAQPSHFAVLVMCQKKAGADVYLC